MGNRVNYVIGGAIASVAITLALVAFIPAIQEVPTQSTSLNTLGHVTLSIYDENGNLVGYRQSDNFVTTAALNLIQDGLFQATGFTSQQFKFLALCQGNADTGGTATAVGDTTCQQEMSDTTGRLDGTVSGGADSSIAAPSQTQDIFTGTITLDTADDNKSFGELALFDKTTVGNMFSVAEFTDFLGQTGTQVKVTYTINMAGA